MGSPLCSLSEASFFYWCADPNHLAGHYVNCVVANLAWDPIMDYFSVGVPLQYDDILVNL
jgi:hypothetical protein